jgi:acetolactate synthase-1/2/3 large subunit
LRCRTLASNQTIDELKGMTHVNGAESLVRTLLNSGLDTCFANPGTSEMHFVSALDNVPGMQCVLGLSEGVVTGAADGYARVMGKPAVTLLHCGPGLANGLANLHNARRANTMMVNCVGDQATHHRPLDAPLTADTEGLARTVSAWVRTAAHATQVGADAAVAVQMAMTSPGQIATLILPSDTCWDAGGVPARALAVPSPPTANPHAIQQAARLLKNGAPTLMILGNGALRAGTIAAAYKIALATGAKIVAPNFNALIERGGKRSPIDRIPYVVEPALLEFSGIKQIILIGTAKPPFFFAYPSKPASPFPGDAHTHVMTRPEHDQAAAMAALAIEVGALGETGRRLGTPRPHPASGSVTSEAFAQSLTALLPEDTIIADEGLTFGRAVFSGTHNAPAHDWMAVPGGAIGGGMPLATGAAVAAAGRRRVVNLQADGSAMYSIQSLWTQARQKLDVTTVIFSNRKYAILLAELENVRASAGKTALSMLELTNPDLDFVKLAAGMGVEGARAETMEQFNDLFTIANKRSGPFLIELAC